MADQLQTLARLASAYRQMSYGGAPLKIQRLEDPQYAYAPFGVHGPMELHARFKSQQAAVATLRKAGFSKSGEYWRLNRE